MAKKHSNIVGVKLTYGSVAKIAAVLPKNEFAIFGGQSDFITGGLGSGSSDCIAAFANVFPKTISHTYTLYQEGKINQRGSCPAQKGGPRQTAFKTGYPQPSTLQPFTALQMPALRMQRPS